MPSEEANGGKEGKAEKAATTDAVAAPPPPPSNPPSSSSKPPIAPSSAQPAYAQAKNAYEALWKQASQAPVSSSNAAVASTSKATEATNGAPSSPPPPAPQLKLHAFQKLVGDDAFIRLFIAQSPKFAFGFTGFKGARDDNQVSGQILFGGNFTCRSPRLSRWLYGFTK